jgi:hypothetical protein
VEDMLHGTKGDTLRLFASKAAGTGATETPREEVDATVKVSDPLSSPECEPPMPPPCEPPMASTLQEATQQDTIAASSAIDQPVEVRTAEGQLCEEETAAGYAATAPVAAEAVPAPAAPAAPTSSAAPEEAAPVHSAAPECSPSAAAAAAEDAPAPASAAPAAPLDGAAELMAMGFSKAQAQQALDDARGDVELAVTMITSAASTDLHASADSEATPNDQPTVDATRMDHAQVFVSQSISAVRSQVAGPIAAVRSEVAATTTVTASAMATATATATATAAAAAAAVRSEVAGRMQASRP